MTDLQERARFRKSFSTAESRAKLRDCRNDNSNSDYVETTVIRSNNKSVEQTSLVGLF